MVQRAGASTQWKEFTTAEGRKYYYNKVTDQYKWPIPGAPITAGLSYIVDGSYIYGSILNGRTSANDSGSKAIPMFEDDERFNAVERNKKREDLLENYLVELQKKKKAKAAQLHKNCIASYRAFLESCDFIKANTQWREIQERLEDDERCFRLEKIDRLSVFQEYIQDLEKEEVDQRRIKKATSNHVYSQEHAVQQILDMGGGTCDRAMVDHALCKPESREIE